MSLKRENELVKKIDILSVFMRSLSIFLFIVLTFGLSLSSMADPEVQEVDRGNENRAVEERDQLTILEQIMNAEVKVPKHDEVTPEDFCDDNPDHHYFYDPRHRRWFWVTEDEPRDKHWAPFDYEAGTGKYIECEGDKWYSFAPVYNGKRVQIYTDEELGITTVYDEEVIEEAEKKEGVDNEIVEAQVPEAPASALTEEADTESLAENTTGSVIERKLEETSSIESVNVPEISAEEDKSENVKSEEVREADLTADETQILEVQPKEETFKEPPTAESGKRDVINQVEPKETIIIVPGLSVPADGTYVQDDIDTGKEVDSFLSYSFTLNGWSFNEFLGLVKYSGMRILYFSRGDSLQEENDEIIEVDSNGNPVLERNRKLDISNYSMNKYPLSLISDSWQNSEIYLNSEYQVNNKMLLLFPYYFLAYLEEAIKMYCHAHEKDYNVLLKKDAGTVKFTITKDYKFKILSMGKTK